MSDDNQMNGNGLSLRQEPIGRVEVAPHRRRSLINEIRRVLGDDAQELIKTMVSVALGKEIPMLDSEGRPVFEPRRNSEGKEVSDPLPAVRRPTLKDMLAAAEFLTAYGWGKPAQLYEIVSADLTPRATPKDLLKSLTDEELFLLTKIQRKLEGGEK